MAKRERSWTVRIEYVVPNHGAGEAVIPARARTKTRARRRAIQAAVKLREDADLPPMVVLRTWTKEDR